MISIFAKTKNHYMKKIILSAVMLLGLAFSAQAQTISKNALGLRLGDSGGFGTEITYQRGLGDNNRLELDLGLRSRKKTIKTMHMTTAPLNLPLCTNGFGTLMVV
jgi:hypothetical protein